jgi:hypothetical protein
MARKPTYEASEQRVKELNKEASKFKQSDIALKESEERYRAIVAAFDGLIYVCSQDYRVEFMNDNFIKCMILILSVHAASMNRYSEEKQSAWKSGAPKTTVGTPW